MRQTRMHNTDSVIKMASNTGIVMGPVESFPYGGRDTRMGAVLCDK